MSRKLTKIVDAEAGSALLSVIGDPTEFNKKVESMLDLAEGILLEHYRNIKVMDEIHAIKDPQTLFDFKCVVVPKDAMRMVARDIEAAYGTDPIHVQVTLYLEVMTQLNAAGSKYLKNCLQQRVQALATEQGSRIVIPSSKIIS